MKYKNIVALSLTACMLAACGGGGGSNNMTTPNNQGNSAQPTPPAQPAPSNLVTGYAYTVPKVGSAPDSFELTDGSRQQVKVGGTTVPLAWSGISSGGFTSITDASSKVVASGNRYKYTRFAYYKTKSTGKAGLLVNGAVTDVNDVPAAGIAKYTGEALAAAIDTGIDVEGKAAFDVDFAAKTVKGTLNNWQNANGLHPGIAAVNIDAKINGNTFSQNGATKANGAFYGPSAVELGGVASTSEVVASFGAKKQ